MLKRCYRVQESQVRYWAQQAVALCDAIEDESLDASKVSVLAAIEAMGQDRRVVLIGASGSGKSTLLGGMVGCPVLGEAAWPGLYVRWRYMSEADDAVENCRFLPDPGLFGMELVDTPGCESPAVAAAVAPLLPGADVIVAVVDAREMPASPVWDMLSTLPEEGGPSILVALTHADTLSAEHAIGLTEAARQLCQERLGRVLPVYQINPCHATLADEFGDKVVEAMESASGGLRAAIRLVMKYGSDMLYKQGSILKARDAVARTDSGFLQGVEQEIDNFLERQLQGVESCAVNYAASAQRSLPKLLVHLRRSLGWHLSPVVLLRLDNYAIASEEFYYSLVLDDVTLQQEELDKQFVISCNGHWRSVRPRMKQTLQCEIGDFPASILEAELDQLRQRFESSLYGPFLKLRIRSHFSSMFKCQVVWMRFFIASVCLWLILAGVLGFCGLELLALGCVGLSALFWLVGTLMHLLVVRKICQHVRMKGETLHRGLSSHMTGIVRDMIVSRVAAYRRLYTGPRQRVADYETSLAPLQQRQSEIFRQLRSSAPHV